MDNKQLTYKALSEFGTSSSKQLSAYIKRKYKEDVSPASVAGYLRSMASRGEVAYSNCGAGSTMYWVATPAWKCNV